MKKTKFNNFTSGFEERNGKPATECTNEELNKNRARLSSVHPDDYAMGVIRGIEKDMKKLKAKEE